MKSLPFFLSLLLVPTLVFGNQKAKELAISDSTATNGAYHDPFDTGEATTVKPEVKVSDPLERLNRTFFKFNDKFYFWFFKPVVTGYSAVVPKPARVCVNRFFINAEFPVRFVNNILQGKFKGAGYETGRFLVNTTVGVAGFFDPAKSWKLAPHPADLDQTLGVHHIPTGIYFCWPVFGPSTVRGTVGTCGDSALTPWSYFCLPVSMGVPAYDMLNNGSLHAGEYEDLKKSTFDPYAALRSAYLENRQSLIEQQAGAGSSPTP
jgi:phospholipid-binding lipoprotein MlaA